MPKLPEREENPDETTLVITNDGAWIRNPGNIVNPKEAWDVLYEMGYRFVVGSFYFLCETRKIVIYHLTKH